MSHFNQKILYTLYTLVLASSGISILNIAANEVGCERVTQNWDDECDNPSPEIAKTTLGTVLNHGNMVSLIVFSPDGKILASSGWDQVIRCWDSTTGKERSNFTVNGGFDEPVAFSPDGKFLVVAVHRGHAISLRKADTGEEIQMMGGHKDEITSIVFSPDSKTLVSASKDNTIRLWDVNTKKEIRQFEKIFGNPDLVARDIIRSVVFSPDGKFLVAKSEIGKIRRDSIGIWDMQSGKLLRKFGGKSITHPLAFSPCGKMLASDGPDEGTIVILDFATGQKIQEFRGHRSFVKCVAFSPDGKVLASGGDDNTVRLWEIKSGKEIEQLLGHKDVVSSVAFSPDGKNLASASYDHTIRIWNITAEKR